MASPRISSPPPSATRAGFLDSSGQPIDRPAEWAPCFFELPPDEGWADYSVHANGRRLEVSQRKVAGQVRTLAHWSRVGTGNYRLTWRLDRHVGTRRFSIAPAKISPSAYTLMLEDLESRLPASIALRLSNFGALSGLKKIPPKQNTLDQEIVRLTRAVEGTSANPGLAEVLKELARDHHVMLASREEWVPVQRGRRPPASRIAASLYRGSNLVEDESFPGGIGPLRVIDARVEETADVYENRLVKSFWREVDLRLRRVAAIVGADGEGVRAATVSRLQTSLEASRRQARFLDDVRLLQQPPVNLTMVLLRNPPYRAALSGYQQLHRDPRIHHDDDRLDAPLRNLPKLYQLWCTLSLFDELLRLAGEAGYELLEQRLVRRHRKSGFVRVVPDGEPALVLRDPATGAVVRAVPEQTYGKSGRIRSSSFSQKPDVAIEVDRPGERPEVYLFDPKYKLDSEDAEQHEGRPKKVDIDKMHAYRDAIRDGEGRRVVRYAAILYPGGTERYGAGLAAMRAVPGEGEQLAESALAGILGRSMEEGSGIGARQV